MCTHAHKHTQQSSNHTHRGVVLIIFVNSHQSLVHVWSRSVIWQLGNWPAPSTCPCCVSMSEEPIIFQFIQWRYQHIFFVVCLPLCLMPKILLCWMSVERLLYPFPSYITSGTELCWQLHGHWFKASNNGEFCRGDINYNDFYRLQATSTQATELALYLERWRHDGWRFSLTDNNVLFLWYKVTKKRASYRRISRWRGVDCTKSYLL